MIWVRVFCFGYSVFPSQLSSFSLWSGTDMARQPRSIVDTQLYPDGIDLEPGGSAVSWSAIIAGTVVAISISITLLVIGSAFGLASVSPWPGVGTKPTSFTI